MQNKRLLELDSLRGIAAISVLIYHYFFIYNEYYKHSFNFPEFLKFGRYGVELFFIISGFVIFWTLSNSQQLSDFLFSRFARLFPGYWATVILTFICLLLIGLPNHNVSLIDLILNFTMLQDYFSYPHVDGVYWTLTLELAFYFWMGCLFYFKRQENIESYLFLWIIISCILIYHRFNFDINNKVKAFFLLQYIQFFALGICFYKIKQNLINKWVVSVVIMSFFAILLKYSNYIALSLILISIVVLLAALGKLKFLSIKPLVFLGTISYPLYLIHQNIGYMIIRYSYSLGLNPSIGIIFATVVSLSLATAICYLIEKPAQKYLKNVYSRHTKEV